MISSVIGGAMLPHAPQFFTLPDTEDKAVVARVREVAADVGRRLRALEPELWIIFSNDHAEQPPVHPRRRGPRMLVLQPSLNLKELLRYFVNVDSLSLQRSMCNLVSKSVVPHNLRPKAAGTRPPIEHESRTIFKSQAR